MSTQTAQRNIYTPKLLHAETLYTQSSFYTQKLFRTEAFRHRSLYAQQVLHRPFYPQMPLHRKTFTHRNFCTQHTFPHSQLLHGETLLPLLDYLPFVFPLSRSLKWFWLKLVCCTQPTLKTRTLQIVPCQQLVVNTRLTCDAFGVLPPVSKLTPSQAMPHG